MWRWIKGDFYAKDDKFTFTWIQKGCLEYKPGISAALTTCNIKVKLVYVVAS